MPTLTRLALIAIALCGVSVACSKRKTGGEEFLDMQLAELEKALAARDLAGVFVGCPVTTDLESPVATRMKKLCSVDVPILILEDSIADATKNAAEFPPEMKDMSCTQLFAPRAFEAVAEQPSLDPRLTRLVEQYTKLCPEAVAKLKAAKPPAPTTHGSP
ncbi:MAG: hypothetical protein H0T42_06400 [Deltaproteobacteria bacterium]|nr:hypothetical protein [Deltaproteobacteria bacterium]